MWNMQIDYLMKDRPEGWNAAEFPNFKKWQEAMLERPAMKKVVSVMMDKEVGSDGKA